MIDEQSASESPKPMRVGATSPAIVQAPRSANTNASHIRGDERSRKNSAPPMTVAIGPTAPMKAALAILVLNSEMWKKPMLSAKARPAKTSRRAEGRRFGASRCSRCASLAHAASAGTASPTRQAPAANGPTSARRTSTPDQAVINVPTIIAATPARSTFGWIAGSAASTREMTDMVPG